MLSLKLVGLGGGLLYFVQGRRILGCSLVQLHTDGEGSPSPKNNGKFERFDSIELNEQQELEKKQKLDAATAEAPVIVKFKVGDDDVRGRVIGKSFALTKWFPTSYKVATDEGKVITKKLDELTLELEDGVWTNEQELELKFEQLKKIKVEKFEADHETLLKMDQLLARFDQDKKDRNKEDNSCLARIAKIQVFLSALIGGGVALLTADQVGVWNCKSDGSSSTDPAPDLVPCALDEGMFHGHEGVFDDCQKLYSNLQIADDYVGEFVFSYYFPQVQEITGNVLVEGIDGLTNFAMSDENRDVQIKVGGVLYVTDNDALITFDLSGVSQAADIYLKDYCPRVIDFKQLSRVQGQITFECTDTDTLVFPKLTEIGGSLSFVAGPFEIDDLQMPELKRVGVKFEMRNMNYLELLELPNLENVGFASPNKYGDLVVESNDGLTTVLFSDLVNVGHDISMKYNPKLSYVDINALAKVKKVSITDNDPNNNVRYSALERSGDYTPPLDIDGSNPS